MKTYKFNIGGKNYEVLINSIEGKNASVTVNGKNYDVAIEQGIDAPVAAPVNPIATPVAAPVQAAAQAQATPAVPVSGKGTQVLSPLPGVILKVEVTVGQAVKEGQTVAVLEAMKMENSIEAECDGTITAIHVSKGESVLESAPIVTIG